ncbi:Integrator complex subunit 10 [Nymphon striatum]|nr:Integrator complex subunit 10 [Nymphon striatum]
MSAAAMESNRNLTSDEDYLVNCAINKETVDSYAAKAWLLTAKTMFPKSFRIQFEEYNIHKKAINCKAAADCVVEMYREFINYNDLWVEIKNIWTSINSDAQDEESKILSEIFQNIPKDTQQLILLSAAEHSKDSFEQCTIIFLVLKLFPRCIRKHGIPLIDMFLSAENCLQPYNPLNIYRSMLVCEVLPMLLKSSHISMSPDQLYQLLLKGIEYYVVSAVGGKSENFHSESQDPSIIWKNMFTLFDIVGKKLNWELHDIFAPRNFTESQWQRIQNLFILYNECQDKSRNVMLHSQLLFSSLILFVHCLYGYSVTCNPDYFPVSKPVINTQLILVEDVKSCADPKLFNSKDLLEQPSILVSSSKSDLISSTLTHNFTVAVKCYDLLHSETFLQGEL